MISGVFYKTKKLKPHNKKINILFSENIKRFIHVHVYDKVQRNGCTCFLADYWEGFGKNYCHVVNGIYSVSKIGFNMK